MEPRDWQSTSSELIRRRTKKEELIRLCLWTFRTDLRSRFWSCPRNWIPPFTCDLFGAMRSTNWDEDGVDFSKLILLSLSNHIHIHTSTLLNPSPSKLRDNIRLKFYHQNFNCKCQSTKLFFSFIFPVRENKNSNHGFLLSSL